MIKSKHTPVLLDLILQQAGEIKGKRLIDATAGEGGYTAAFLQAGAKVLAVDIDPKQIMKLKKNLKEYIEKGNLYPVSGNFANLGNIAKRYGFYPADLIIFDLGLSWHQIAESGKGFSFKAEEEPLDMRFNKRFKYTAADLLNSLPGNQLYDIFASFAQEPYSREITQEILKIRKLKKFKKVKDLTKVIKNLVPAGKYESAARRIFQALRIAVNNEIQNLKKGLEQAEQIISENGRIFCLTFHPTEDRVVKNFAREKNLKISLFKNKNPKGNFEKIAKLRVLQPREYKSLWEK